MSEEDDYCRRGRSHRRKGQYRATKPKKTRSESCQDHLSRNVNSRGIRCVTSFPLSPSRVGTTTSRFSTSPSHVDYPLYLSPTHYIHDAPQAQSQLPIATAPSYLSQPFSPQQWTSCSTIPMSKNRICDVWAGNLEAAIGEMKALISGRRLYVGMDTEFPGFVFDLEGDFRTMAEFEYNKVKCHVDAMQILSVAFAFFDEAEQPAGHKFTYQFFFKYDIDKEMFSSYSIDMLTRSGKMDFTRMKNEGVSMKDFADLIPNTGLLNNPNLQFVVYHGNYDMGYLIKAIINQRLPANEWDFLEMLNMYFPNIYDIRFLVKIIGSDNPSLDCKCGLIEFSKLMNIQWSLPAHEAASDSFLTTLVLFNVKRYLFRYHIPDLYNGVIYEMSITGVAKIHPHRRPTRMRQCKKVCGKQSCSITEVVETEKKNDPVQSLPIHQITQRVESTDAGTLEKFSSTDGARRATDDAPSDDYVATRQAGIETLSSDIDDADAVKVDESEAIPQLDESSATYEVANDLVEQIVQGENIIRDCVSNQVAAVEVASTKAVQPIVKTEAAQKIAEGIDKRFDESGTTAGTIEHIMDVNAANTVDDDRKPVVVCRPNVEGKEKLSDITKSEEVAETCVTEEAENIDYATTAWGTSAGHQDIMKDAQIDTEASIIWETETSRRKGISIVSAKESKRVSERFQESLKTPNTATTSVPISSKGQDESCPIVDSTNIRRKCWTTLHVNWTDPKKSYSIAKPVRPPPPDPSLDFPPLQPPRNPFNPVVTPSEIPVKKDVHQPSPAGNKSPSGVGYQMAISSSYSGRRCFGAMRPRNRQVEGVHHHENVRHLLESPSERNDFRDSPVTTFYRSDLGGFRQRKLEQKHPYDTRTSSDRWTSHNLYFNRGRGEHCDTQNPLERHDSEGNSMYPNPYARLKIYSPQDRLEYNKPPSTLEFDKPVGFSDEYNPQGRQFHHHTQGRQWYQNAQSRQWHHKPQWRQWHHNPQGSSEYPRPEDRQVHHNYHTRLADVTSHRQEHPDSEDHDLYLRSLRFPEKHTDITGNPRRHY